MAKVEIKAPTIVVIEYHQEKSDKDYGSCLWARFVLDTKNYELHITSDCGKYGYSGWTPTPDTESFLKLLLRMDSEYLLSKISDMYVVDTEKTYKAISELINDVVETFSSLYDKIDMERIHTACSYAEASDVVYDIQEAIRYTPLYDILSQYNLHEFICKDYPASAKKIVEIFHEYIQPKIKEMLEEEQ